MTERNLWGDLPEGSTIVPPVAIMREQGAMLTTLTKGMLEGRVSSTADTAGFNVSLHVVAPSLKYTSLIARVHHKVTLYPAFIFDTLNSPGGLPCPNETVLVQRLEKILQSTKVRNLIAALMLQVKASQ